MVLRKCQTVQLHDGRKAIIHTAGDPEIIVRIYLPNGTASLVLKTIETADVARVLVDPRVKGGINHE
jgi:hypothetical protein